MIYLATISLDYTDTNIGGYQKLQAALIQTGWTYSETSTLYVETEDLEVVRRGLALLAHGIDGGGTLSNLNVTVHLVGDPYTPRSVTTHRYAVEQIMDRPIVF